jgi:hypothetical protein
MSRYAAIAGALVALAVRGGAAAAQEILVPEGGAAAIAAASSSAAADKPARPTNLIAKATSTSEARLNWSDNAANEWEYRIEIRYDDRGWEEMGAIPPNATSVLVFALDPGKTYSFRLRARNGAGLSAYSNEAPVTAYFAADQLGACQSGPATLCLRGGRYRVQAAYEANEQMAGAARAVTLTGDSGYFWFFDELNIEVVVKMVAGCAVNHRQWVFTTGLTNVRVMLLVTDMETGATATYLNERGRPFAPVQDTDAFATCS